MKKRIISLLLCGVVLFTGCGGKKNEPAAGASESVTQEEVGAEGGSESGTASAGENELSNSDEKAEETVGENGGETESNDIFFGTVENGTYMIDRCTSTEELIEVPESINGVPVTKIGNNAFFELPCKKIILPDTIDYIGEYAFFYCEALEEIDLGSGLKRMEAQAFANCSSLKTVSFPEGMESIHCPFFMNDELGEVYIPSSVTEVLEGIGSPATCPKMVVVTPSGSVAEAEATAEGYPVRNN